MSTSTITVYHYDAFSSTPNKGNPAGVVLEADFLSETAMQNIAHAVGFNETVFVTTSHIADIRLRYFTPGHEINLCGHATMASLYCLMTKGMLANKTSVTIETKVGVLPIYFTFEQDTLRIEMKQDSPSFVPFYGNIERLAQSIGLSSNELDLSKPIVYGSTGTWTVLIPIKQLSSFTKMKPDNKRFPDILIENPKASVHPFCMETYDDKAFMHARHFSSPYSGTIEDPVTGTASGVMGAYYLNYMDTEEQSVEFTVEQGHEMNKDGRVLVKAIRHGEHIEVAITGTAVFVKEMIIEYDKVMVEYDQ